MSIWTEPHHADRGSDNSIPRSARVWLVAPLSNAGEPADRPVVRDDLMRTWLPDTDNTGYHTLNGGRHTTWEELHCKFDLVEV